MSKCVGKYWLYIMAEIESMWAEYLDGYAKMLGLNAKRDSPCKWTI